MRLTISIQAFKKLFYIVVIAGILIIIIILKHVLNVGSHSRSIVESSNAKLYRSTQKPKIEKILPTTEQLWFVKSSQCKIPYVNPFTKELLKIYEPWKFISCKNDSDLVTPIFDVNRKRYVLHIHDDVARQLLNSSVEEYKCYYQEAPYSKDNEDAEPLAPIYFTQDYVVPLHIEGLLVACHSLSNASHVLQSDAFFLVQHKFPHLPAKLVTNKIDKKPPRKPSVIMFGIDSLSRINFRRTMPKVFEFFNQREWYELQGYNKIDDNTFPNLMAVLSGYNSETSKNICDTDESGCFDRFPFIWNYFKNASYLTAYAEDESNMGTFSYLKPGFDMRPVDFYYRPFLKIIEDKLNIYIYDNCYMRYCIGRRLTSSYVYDICQLFMRRFVDEHPIFGFFWTNSFSHDDYAMPSLMADKVLQYLQDFEAEGVFNSTIMIFFSDHGTRFGGSLLNLPEGFLEERLPTLFIWLPPWFRAQYPEYAQALQLNRNRLTSNYDLHMTLKHIIELGSADKLELPQAADCPKCQTLFKPIPENRTCADAAITDHWCTCHPFEMVTVESYTDPIVPLIIDQMNAYFVAKNLSSLCRNLTMKYTFQIERKLNLTDNGHDVITDSSIYRAKFKVAQNSADFQATVTYNNRTQSLDVNVETISRLNRYHDDSLCINDKIAKKYCICYNSTNTAA